MGTTNQLLLPSGTVVCCYPCSLALLQRVCSGDRHLEALG
jgi:hypothetical protein